MQHILILLGIQYLKYKINKKLVRLSGTKRHTAGWSEKTTSPPSARVAAKCKNSETYKGAQD